MNVKEKILTIFNRVMHSSFSELNISRNQFPEWDSMKHAELIIELQKEFNIKFKVKEIVDIRNAFEFFPIIEAQKGSGND